MIKSISYDQLEIIDSILKLHCKTDIELDPCYGYGGFYKLSGSVQLKPPELKFDIDPKLPGIRQGNANNLDVPSSGTNTIIFDPPFFAKGSNKKDLSIMGNKYGSYPYMKDLQNWYRECLLEFYRILKKRGILIVKCQDSVSGCKQYFNHVFIMNEAEKIGYKQKDLFVLLAKHRMIGRIKKQRHARKFHSYFLVFKK